MSAHIFGFIFAMWVLILVGGGLMVLIVGPISFSGYNEIDPIINSGIKVLIALTLIFIPPTKIMTPS